MRRKIISISVVFIMLSCTILQYSMREDMITQASGKRDEYIVKADDISEFKELKEVYKDERIINHNNADEYYLEKSKTVVLELTEAEAGKLEDDGLAVEEDQDVSGCTLKNVTVEDNKGSVKPYNIQEGTNESCVNPEEFKPIKPIKGGTDILPWGVEHMKSNISKKTGKGIRVAVLDSGIDMHDDLKTKKWIDFSDTVSGYKPTDFTGHGTQMAGIIQAQKNGYGIVGLAPASELYSVRVLNSDNEASVSTVIKGIEWCIENNIQVINMSFGMDSYSELLHETVKRAYDRGIVMVASAGNKSKVQYPAAFSEVIAVGSIDSESNVSAFSPVGDGIDYYAPGEDVTTTNYVGTFANSTGTSIAAAHITGFIAGIMGKNKEIDSKNVRRMLSRFRDKVGLNKIICNSDKENDLEENKLTKENKESGNKLMTVSANWIGNWWLDKGITGHLNYINSFPAYLFARYNNVTRQEENRKITAYAAMYTDDAQLSAKTKSFRNSSGSIANSGTRVYSQYHARTAYSLSTVKNKQLRFLYELARRRICLSSNLDLTPTNYKGNSYYGINLDMNYSTEKDGRNIKKLSGQLVKRTIVNDLNYLYKEKMLKTQAVNIYNMNTVEHKGYMVLGVYLHLLGDIYAHRTQVIGVMFFTTGYYQNGYPKMRYGATMDDSWVAKSHFASEAAFKELRGRYMSPNQDQCISMIRLKDYLAKRVVAFNPATKQNVTIDSNVAYEDNPYFYSKRFEATLQFSKQSIQAMKVDTGTKDSFQFWNAEDIKLLNGYN